MSSIFKDFGVNARADAASLHDAEAEKDMTSNMVAKSEWSPRQDVQLIIPNQEA